TVAMAGPIASPPNRPVRMPIRVIPICTVDRKFSGFSASDRARAARLLAWASCLSRLLREVITDISDIAKKPLSRMRAKTISSSATRAYPAACMGGLLDGPGRQGAAGVGAGVVVHRLRPRAPRDDSRGAAAATRAHVAPRQYRAPARAVIIRRI